MSDLVVAGAMKIDCGYGLLQSILKQRNIPFQIAPHKANAQVPKDISAKCDVQYLIIRV